MSGLIVYSLGSIEITPDLKQEIENHTGLSVGIVVNAPKSLLDENTPFMAQIARNKEGYPESALLFHREANETLLIAMMTRILAYDTEHLPRFITVDGGWDRASRTFIHHVNKVV